MGKVNLTESIAAGVLTGVIAAFSWWVRRRRARPTRAQYVSWRESYWQVAAAMARLQGVHGSIRVVLLAVEDGRGVVLHETASAPLPRVSNSWSGMQLDPWYTAMLAAIPLGETFFLDARQVPSSSPLFHYYKADRVVGANITMLALGPAAGPYSHVYISENLQTPPSQDPAKLIAANSYRNAVRDAWRTLACVDL